MFTPPERKAPRGQPHQQPAPTPAAPAPTSRPILDIARKLRGAGAAAKTGRPPELEGPQQRHWRVTILSGHGQSMGTHQSADFQAAVWRGQMDPNRQTECHWVLKRDSKEGFTTVQRGAGQQYQVSGLAPGLYVLECSLVQKDAPRAFQASADAVAVSTRPRLAGSLQLRFPPTGARRPGASDHQQEAHPSNPFVGGPWHRDEPGLRGDDGELKGSAEQAAQDSVPVGPEGETVVARDEYQFRVSRPEDYTRAVLDRHREELPLGSLEEELQLIPEQNADNAASINPDKSPVTAKSDRLRDRVNLPNILPGMGATDSSSDRDVTRVHAVLSQNDGIDVHLRLFMATIRRGNERFIRLVELPLMNTPDDANRIRSYDGDVIRKPGDEFGSFMTAIQAYAEKSPHGHGALRFEVEGRADLAGTLLKGPSELALAAENIDQLAEITKLLAMIPPISTPMGVATALLSAGSASLKAADQYNRGEDNTEAAADAVVSLLEFGGGLSPKGTGQEVWKASKRVFEAARNATRVAQAVQNHQEVDPDDALKVLKDALAFGRVVAPETFAPSHYAIGTRRVIVRLSQAYRLGEKMVEYVNLPEDFSQKFTELASTGGLSDAERLARLTQLMKSALE
ncbi:hypothetical protein [Deinococcus sedimenti]|uniref:Uncharacterized protein n=1 Tax=Deinococcus sedimenti TaxID=1867090 RepID=A0ABQ2S5M5_9DEIO|nr:hypothetical protein [Deinococcus sedimenti]GGR99827.1 hypothetical protein GCM10008960_28120 [Deinococcus sedimenti]